MKSLQHIICGLAVFGFTLTAQAELPVKGDGFDRVVELLGEPSGMLSIGEKRFLYFERGSVVLIEGKVVEMDLVSDKDFEAQKKKEAAERKALAEAEAAAEEAGADERAARIEEGLVVKEKMLNSLEFQNKPVEQRIGLWRLFMRKYPEVPVGRSYLTDLQLYEQKMAVKKKEEDNNRRMAALERRVRDAETRAAQAERDAALAAREAADNSRESSSRRRYYTPIYYPYIIRKSPSAGHSTPRAHSGLSGGSSVTPRSPNQLKHLQQQSPARPRTVAVPGAHYDPHDKSGTTVRIIR